MNRCRNINAWSKPNILYFYQKFRTIFSCHFCQIAICRPNALFTSFHSHRQWSQGWIPCPDFHLQTDQPPLSLCPTAPCTSHPQSGQNQAHCITAEQHKNSPWENWCPHYTLKCNAWIQKEKRWASPSEVQSLIENDRAHQRDEDEHQRAEHGDEQGAFLPQAPRQQRERGAWCYESLVESTRVLTSLDSEQM